jgi:hypothetical protein
VVERRVNLRREEVAERDGWLETGVTIESPGTPRRRLWYRVRLPTGWTLSDSSEPFALVPLHQAMRLGVPMHVEGALSPSLLANLEEYQAVFARWYPNRFRQIEIVPEHEREREPAARGAVFTFSGGVDSCFTAFSHATGRAGRQTQPLLAGVMAQGFDIPNEETELFESAFSRTERTLACLGLPLIAMATNVRLVEHAWNDMMSAAIASCLALLQPNASTGLIPGEFAYHLMPRWGVHPLTDPLLSSESFRIANDGAGFTRMEKIETIAEWPEAFAGLRVCWAGRQRDRNCGCCSKCVRTILAIRAVGLPLPPSFEQNATNRQIRAIGRLDRVEQRTQRALLDTIAERAVSGSWVRASRSLYYRSRGRDLLDLVADRARRRL